MACWWTNSSIRQKRMAFRDTGKIIRSAFLWSLCKQRNHFFPSEIHHHPHYDSLLSILSCSEISSCHTFIHFSSTDVFLFTISNRCLVVYHLTCSEFNLKVLLFSRLCVTRERVQTIEAESVFDKNAISVKINQVLSVKKERTNAATVNQKNCGDQITRMKQNQSWFKISFLTFHHLRSCNISEKSFFQQKD